MKRHFIIVDSISIAYCEKNATASKTIFFIHGNSGSKNSWRKQFDSGALSAYRLIAFDLPAHGESGVLDEVFYTLIEIAKLMSKAITMLAGLNPYIISGVSLGTNIVAEMLSFDVHPLGLILAGPCIVGENLGVEKFVKQNIHVGVVFTDMADFEDIKIYATETSLSESIEDMNYFFEDYNAVLSPFRSALGKSIAEKKYVDEIEIINLKNVPCLVVFGKDERVIDCNYLDNTILPLWKNTIFKIAGASHLVNIDQTEKFNQLVSDFSKEIFL